jgi:hypothetical protein
MDYGKERREVVRGSQRSAVAVHPEEHAVGASAPAVAARVLELQASVGNAGVNRLLSHGQIARALRHDATQPAGAGRRLQRFVGWEHERLGNEGSSTAQCSETEPWKCAPTPTRIEVAPGVSLTWGQVVALAGDEFGKVEDLVQAATAAGPAGAGGDALRGRLRAAMHHDLDWRPSSSGTNAIAANLYDGGDAATKAQTETFRELAFHNLDHFPDQRKARDAWTRHHDLAVWEALRAGAAGDAARLNKAYLYEAFGEHYLTDCFSAGHIRTPRTTIYNWYERNFADRAIWGLEYWLLSKYVASPIIPPEQLQSLLRMLEQPLKRGFAQFRDKLFVLAAGAVSGAIHDYEGDAGVVVTATALPGQQWRTYGDATLPGAPGRDPATTSGQAEKLAVLAIQTAKGDVDAAYRLGGQLVAEGIGTESNETWTRLRAQGIRSPYDYVWNFVPKAVPASAPWGGTTWQWGSFTPWLKQKVNAYILDKISGSLPELLKGIDEHVVDANVAPEGQKPFNPHKFLADQIAKLAVDPVGTIGEMVLWSALDPTYEAAAPQPPPSRP